MRSVLPQSWRYTSTMITQCQQCLLGGGFRRHKPAHRTDGGLGGVSTRQMAATSAHQADPHLDGALYLVATPIGNMDDITLRALKVLRSCSLILAEDTRHTRQLLSHHDISTPTMSYHAWNERERETYLMQRLMGGETIALVSDAGTPAISDPGEALVAAAVQNNIKVVPIPGACALVSAVIASGLPTTSFSFCGFLPPKSGSRQKCLQELRSSEATLLFYVPPHALLSTLSDMASVLGATRRCCVAREVTKMHEEFFRATLGEAAEEFTKREPRGEIVLVVDGFHRTATDQVNDAEVQDVLTGLLREGVPVSSAVRETMEAVGARVGMRRKDVYELALALKRGLTTAGASGHGVA